MSPPGRRCRGLLRLLTVLWAVRASRTQTQANFTPGLDPQQLLRLIVHDVTSELKPLVDNLDLRLGGVIDKLDYRFSSIEARVNALDCKQSSFDAKLKVLASRVDVLASGRSGILDGVPSHPDQLTKRSDEVPASTSTQAQLSPSAPSEALPPLYDCSDLPAGAVSGIHMIQPGGNLSQSPVATYCDLDTDGGGWTVFQRRKDIQPRQSFDLDWSQYRAGFGELDGDFWWGLEHLWKVTSSKDRHYELRVDLADWDGGRRYAVYRRFKVASEDEGFRLLVTNYTGDAGDSLRKHNSMKFSTKDRDQDTDTSGNCAERFKGGWWYLACYDTHLNGLPHSGKQGEHGGIVWQHWRGFFYSLKETVMRVRPIYKPHHLHCDQLQEL